MSPPRGLFLCLLPSEETPVDEGWEFQLSMDRGPPSRRRAWICPKLLLLLRISHNLYFVSKVPYPVSIFRQIVPISRWWFRAKFDLAPNILIKCWNFAKLRSNFAHISQNIRKKSLKFCTCFENFAKHSQSAHILMTISVKFRNLLPKCYQNANICKISLNFRWLCYRNPKFCWYQDRNAGMPLYFVEKVVIYRRNFGKIKSPENPPYLEIFFAKYRLWPSRLTCCFTTILQSWPWP